MRERGVEAVAVELDEGEPLPDWREFDAVLAMGGPMGAGDDAEHPWLAAERRLVREAVEAGRPFLGVCLGRAAARGRARRPGLRGRARRRSACSRSSSPTRAAPTRCSPASTSGSSRCSGTATPSTCPPGPCAWRARRRRRTRRSAPASAPTGSSSTSRSRPRWRASGARSRPTATRSPRRSARRGGAEFIADVERRAGELHPSARRLFANWLELAGVPA